MSKAPTTYQGSYGDFLKTLRRATEGSQPELVGPVLKALDAAGGELRMKALLGQLGVAPIQLVRAVELMKSQGIVTVESSIADDLIRLTDTGRSVAKLS